jgi:Tfp pilus assembly pilus retraction ATPase PilT
MAVDKRLEELLDIVVSQNGSDLHVFAGGAPTIRVAGSLIPITKHQPFTADETEAMLKSIVPPDRWDVFKESQAIDLSYAHKDKSRFRVNGYRSQGTAALALRLIPQAIHSFAELNLPSVLEVFLQRKQGFFLVVGPEPRNSTRAIFISKPKNMRPACVSVSTASSRISETCRKPSTTSFFHV